MQIGFHFTIDDSVNSTWLENENADKRLKKLVSSRNCDSVWIRATPNGTAFYLKKDGKVL